jgi:hypothetical protein
MSDSEAGKSDSWVDRIAGLVAPMLALGGVLIYAALSVSSEVFYGQLGIDPSEVGLDYGGILTHSTGFVFAILLVGAIIFALLKITGNCSGVGLTGV